MRTNPVLHVEKSVKGVHFTWDEAKVRSVLTGKGHQLKTWGPANETAKPHWIGVTKQTPLHVDPRYPRYTWHLLLWVDNFVLRGVDKTEVQLEDGMMILLDTHSPHQLLAKDKDAVYYIAASIDSKTIIPIEQAKALLIPFINNTDIGQYADRITK